MKVMLVDDETMTIKMLQYIIPWEKLSLEISYMANDGEEAFKEALVNMPDILITDICMSNMDGLTLVRKLLEINKNIKIILMSAFADFSYVKEGMSLGCSDYILKPIDEEELVKALNKVIEEIKGRDKAILANDKSEKKLRRLELYKYIKRGTNLNKLLPLKNDFTISFHKNRIILIQKDSMSIDEYTDVSSLEYSQEKYVENIVKKLIKTKYNKEYLFLDYEEDMWCLIVENLDQDETAKLCQDLYELLKSELSLRVLISFSQESQSLKELPFCFKEAFDLLKYTFYIGEEKIIGYDYNCKSKEIEEIRKLGFAKDIENAIIDGEIERAKEILEEAFYISTIYQKDNNFDIYEFCFTTIFIINKQLEEISKDNKEKLSVYLSYNELKEHQSIKDLRAIMDKVFSSLSQVIKGNEKRQYSKPVIEALELIEEHYFENISLEEISEKISVSKNYFCYLFKREVGSSLWNYLTEVRMRYAKKMLETTDLKTYQIAYDVGYVNPSYFSKLFKKLEGITPNQYRDKMKK